MYKLFVGLLVVLSDAVSCRLQAGGAIIRSHFVLACASLYHSLSLWVIRMRPACLSAHSLITLRETGPNTKYTVCPHPSTHTQSAVTAQHHLTGS